jgi:hypothetical protein
VIFYGCIPPLNPSDLHPTHGSAPTSQSHARAQPRARKNLRARPNLCRHPPPVAVVNHGRQQIQSCSWSGEPPPLRRSVLARLRGSRLSRSIAARSPSPDRSAAVLSVARRGSPRHCCRGCTTLEEGWRLESSTTVSIWCSTTRHGFSPRPTRGSRRWLRSGSPEGWSASGEASSANSKPVAVSNPYLRPRRGTSASKGCCTMIFFANYAVP